MPKATDGDLYICRYSHTIKRWYGAESNRDDYDLFFRGYEQLDGSPCGRIKG